MSPSHKSLGFALVLAAAVFISFSNVLAPLVYDLATNVESLLVLRLVIFLMLCGLWLRLQNIAFKLQPGELRHCIIAGLFYNAGSACLMAAFDFIPVSLAVLIFYAFPLLTSLGESAWDRRRPAPVQLACLLAALIGLAVCLHVGFEQLNMTGLVFAALAALGVASAYLWSGRKLNRLPPALMTFYMAASGLVLVTGILVLRQAWVLPPAEAVAIGVTLAAALAFAIAFFCMFAAVTFIGPARSAMIMNLEPVITVGLAVLLLAEVLTLHQVFGAALVIAAVFASQLFTPAKEGV